MTILSGAKSLGQECKRRIHMTTTAIGMMIFTLAVVGGGFVASIVRLQIISKKQAEEENNEN